MTRCPQRSPCLLYISSQSAFSTPPGSAARAPASFKPLTLRSSNALAPVVSPSHDKKSPALETEAPRAASAPQRPAAQRLPSSSSTSSAAASTGPAATATATAAAAAAAAAAGSTDPFVVFAGNTEFLQLQTTLTMLGKTKGEDHPDTVNACTKLSHFYTNHNEHQLAHPLFMQVLMHRYEKGKKKIKREKKKK